MLPIHNRFDFKGKGSDLFVVILLTLIIPMIILYAVFAGSVFFAVLSGSKSGAALAGITSFLMTLFLLILIIPYIYYVYKWFFNIQYKTYNIHWETNTWDACSKIAFEILLTVITLGIYFPAAYLKLYKFFISHTVAASTSDKRNFDYDLETGTDFLYIWGQTLLAMITLGIYYPWVYCNIIKRVLGKTYLEETVSISANVSPETIEPNTEITE
ncbi:MAG: DUF898 family protein [Paludibacteraceae bacterium]